jgi:hypothetical protein
MATHLSHHTWILGEQMLDTISIVGVSEYKEAMGSFVPLYSIISAPDLLANVLLVDFCRMQFTGFFLEIACHCFGCHGSYPNSTPVA